MRTSYLRLLLSIIATFSPLLAWGQVDSGSDGRDGAFNPTQNTVVNMADHPDGIYQYTSVNIPGNVTVSFIPNPKNTAVVWLVKGSCIINGSVIVSGSESNSSQGALGGPGGYPGGSGGNPPSPGQGPGGGLAGISSESYGSHASYGSLGSHAYGGQSGQPPGVIYGSIFLLPLIGGSGGGGTIDFSPAAGGGGGGGAILIAANDQISINGTLDARGGHGLYIYNGGIAGGCGSGGAVRLVATNIVGTGSIWTDGGVTGSQSQASGGLGRIRFDGYQINFGGRTNGVVTKGFQPIIIPSPGQGVQISIASIGGVAAPPNPGGVISNPDVVIPPQQANPMAVVVNCANVALNSQITVTVHPANGPDVQATGTNTSGNASSSSATIPLNVPRGGGIIYATVLTSIGQASADLRSRNVRSTFSFAATGLAANGERFVKLETKAFIGGKNEATLITASGKRFAVPR
jgi:hypothetical protein